MTDTNLSLLSVCLDMWSLLCLVFCLLAEKFSILLIRIAIDKYDKWGSSVDKLKVTLVFVKYNFFIF